MSDEIAVKKEAFPHAMVPGAQSELEVFEAWKEAGFQPEDVTGKDLTQRIVITHDPLKGEIKWESSANMDGLGVTLMAMETTFLMPAILVAEGAVSIAKYFTRGEGLPDIGTGVAAVKIAFENGRLVLDWFPKNRRIAAKKLLATALAYLIAEDAEMPLGNIAGCIKIAK